MGRSREHLATIAVVIMLGSIAAAMPPALQDPASPVDSASNTASAPRRLRVCALGDGTPIAGATVEVTFSRTGSGPTTLTTNARGEVEIPAFEGYADLRATFDGLVGEAGISSKDDRDGIASSEPRVLYLAEPIVVAVVDHGGRSAAGVAVALAYPFDCNWVARNVRLTDASGTATFNNFTPGTALEYNSRLVRLAIPLATSVSSPISLNRPHAGPVSLALPPTGSLEVRLLAPDGKPFTGRALVTVVPAPIEELTDRDPFFSRDACEVQAADGTAIFPYVGLASPVVVRASPLDDGLCSGQVSTTTPRKPGETRIVEIRCGAPSIRVSGRLLTPGGAPVRYRECSLHLQTGPASGSVAPIVHLEHLHDRAAGRFNGVFDVDATAIDAASVQIDVRYEDPIHRSEGLTQKVRVELPAGYRSGKADLGDITIGQPHLLVSGVVVDTAGIPVEPAWVCVVKKRDDDHWTEISRHTHPSAITRKDGAFELFGTPSENLGLVASSKAGLRLKPVPFAPGTTAARIVLSPAGSIEGAFIAPSAAHLRWPWDGQIAIHIVGQKESIEQEISQGRRLMNLVQWEDRSRFRIWPVAPGALSIEVSLIGSEVPPLRIDEVVVEPGAVCRDPRLAQIDPTRLAPLRRVLVVDESGAPLRSAAVRRSFSWWTTPPWYPVDPDGVAWVGCPDGGEILVSAEHFHPRRVQNVRGDVEVRFGSEDSPRVIMALDPSGAALPAPLEIRARLTFSQPIDDERWQWPGRSGVADSETVVLAAGRSAEIPLAEAGIYSVSYFVVRPARGGRLPAAVPIGGSPDSVTVDRAGATDLRAVLDREDLATATAILGKK